MVYGALAMPICTALLTLPAPNRHIVKQINMIGGLLTSFILFGLVYSIQAGGILASPPFYVDSLSCLLLMVIAVLNLTAFLFSASYMEKELHDGAGSLGALKRYYVLLNTFAFTMISVLVVENLGLMWVCVEATTLASALLVAFHFNRSGIEAAWKYVMVCTVGICLALFGTILLYYAQVSAGPEAGEALSWLALRDISSRLDPGMLKLAFACIIVGYGTKVGLAPMHTWLPDAHSQAPSPVSGLLSGALLSCALYVVMRNLVIVKGAVGTEFIQPMLIGLGLFSVVVAVPFLLVQHDVKRLLAYSSVEHMGMITLALGIGTPLAVYGALFHIFNHAIAKSALFYLAGHLTQEYRTRHIMRIRGVVANMPFGGAAFVLFALAITGVPPFGVFASKFIIAWAAFAGGFKLVGVVLLTLLAAVFAGIVYYCFQMAFSKPTGPVREGKMGVPAMAAIMLSAAIVITSGLYLPEPFKMVLQQAAAVISGG